ncbi:hypothetical protein [Methylobacterium brachythecii]|uniref:Uncharacterized protein n=1 Tax=Methylobacterium brachythecii TaxID=1176177 RepID=A0A7W6F8L3_9HYPH|nr:hypothetical protein [Methylobacterium brachythecii]MBB3904236.1 hypothetical protein [Methylobacterium brachythecii]GLS45102.1 hypothetical protein GCM10007884_30910 [Methylobacterium brachythecii]
MPFEIIKSPDSRNILLDGAQAAEAVYDPHYRAWTIEADRARYPAPADLPGVFRGCHSHEVKAFGDVFRFFGVPLPGVAEAEQSLIEIGRDRVLEVFDRLERDAA